MDVVEPLANPLEGATDDVGRRSRTPSSGRNPPRRQDVQGLRALAILLVVLFHAGVAAERGFVGVDVFFVVSGFVITATLVRELDRRGRVDFARFYRRRVNRLLPALAVMIVLVTAASIVLAPIGIGHIEASTAAFASLFSSNLYLYSLPSGYFAVDQQLNPLLHTWTLGVEEQFYLVFPLLLVASWAFGFRRDGRRGAGKMAIVGVLGLSEVMLFLSVRWWHGSAIGGVGRPEQFAFYSSASRGWEFGAGAVLALTGWTLERTWRWVAPTVATVALGALLAVAFGDLDNVVAGSFSSVAVAVAATTALILAGSGRSNAVSRLLGARPFARVGDLSYSLYLWHWPLIVFALAIWPSSRLAAPLAALCAVLPAWLSYRFVENPIRFDPRFRGAGSLVLATICLAVPLAAAAALGAVQSRLPAAAATADHADVIAGCDVNLPFGSPRRPRCTWPVSNPRGTILLIGDSNAGQYTEPVVQAANHAGYSVRVATRYDCPFIQLRVRWQAYRGCLEFDRDSLAATVRAHPNLVILGARADQYINDPLATLAPLSGGGAARDSNAKADLWTLGLRTEIESLNRAGIPVVVVQPLPVVPTNAQECAVILVLSGGCGGSVSRQVADADLRRALRANERAVQGLDATTLDLEDHVCSVGSCDSRKPSSHGFIMFRDPLHLSVDGARTLSPAFAEVIQTAVRPS